MANTPIPIKSGEEGFGNFIAPANTNNRRIFFSAPFGMGKTYFLKEFFKVKESHYNVFHLYPVKYQVHNDAEIVELIGADLFIKLIEQNLNAVEELLRNEDMLRKFRYTASLLSKCLSSLVGIDVLGILEKIKKLSKNEKLQEAKNAAADMRGNFFEDLVGEILKKIKGNDRNDRKENILILDDLDRLEPKHIFKILNAFSPLQDEEDNKFGFDKVIFVGDIDNLRKVFHHIYGSETDFEGYIDKFFSVAPYRYEIEEELRSVIKQIIAGYSHNEEGPFRQSVEKENGHIASVLFFILMLAVQARKINLRNLFMPQNVPLPCINASTPNQRESKNAQVNISAKILLYLFQNNKKILLDAIKVIEKGIMDKTVFPGSNQDILNVKESGIGMLQEIFVVERGSTWYYRNGNEEEKNRRTNDLETIMSVLNLKKRVMN